MGGFGSGRWNNYSKKKRTVEDCWILDLADILLDDPANPLPCGVLQLVRINGNEFPLPVRYDFVEEEGPYLDITYPRGTRFAQEQVKERVKLLSTRPKFGGARWYLSCPFTTEEDHCDNRVRILYLPPGERRFGCRECHELTYESSQQSHKYDGLYALLAGGEREGETFDFLKGVYSYQLREARREKAQGPGGLLEVYERYFGEDL
jgi:hypothetical protein